jgi:hypothetical protein
MQNGSALKKQLGCTKHEAKEILNVVLEKKNDTSVLSQMKRF